MSALSDRNRWRLQSGAEERHAELVGTKPVRAADRRARLAEIGRTTPRRGRSRYTRHAPGAVGHERCRTDCIEYDDAPG